MKNIKNMLEQEKNKPYCIAPWVSITQTANNHVRPCCIYKDNIGEKGINIKDAWNHPKMIELRKKMIQHKLSDACITCTERKKLIGTNRAEWYDKKINHDIKIWDLKPPMDLLHMDLNFGNKCNLKCRMCGSWGSSLWFKEDNYLQQLNPAFKRTIESSKKVIIHNANKFLYLKDSYTKLQRIDFKGGEPFLQEGMYEFLQYLIDWDYAKNIKVVYTTNGTVYDKRIEKLWPSFKEIFLVLSLDGTGDLYQYIRGGKHHTLDSVIQNMKNFNKFDNFVGSYNVTVQIYNLFNLPDILDFISNINLNRFSTDYEFDCVVTSPTYLNIDILPKNLKQLAVKLFIEHGSSSFDPIIESLSKSNQTEFNEQQLKLFVQFTNELDKLRKTNLLDVEPRLAELFNEK